MNEHDDGMNEHERTRRSTKTARGEKKENGVRLRISRAPQGRGIERAAVSTRPRPQALFYFMNRNISRDNLTRVSVWSSPVTAKLSAHTGLSAHRVPRHIPKLPLRARIILEWDPATASHQLTATS